MPDAKLIPLNNEDNGLYRYERSQWFEAGVDDFTAPPAQNADSFLQLLNTMPPQTGGFPRRWGYRVFGPKLDAGLNIHDDEVVGASTAQVIQARNLYEYQDDDLVVKTIIATASDGSGVQSQSNDVIYWDADGIPTDIFNPSAGATRPRMVTSRSYAYFADGFDGDQQKWNITNGLSKWGIDAPLTAITVGTPSGGGSTTYNLSAAANAVAGNTTYTGVGLNTLLIGATLQIGGFTNAANNGTFTVVSSTNTTVVVDNPSGVTESATATATSQNASRPTTLLNGWGPNVHVGSYEGGVDQGYTFGLDGGTTQVYQNPNNAVDGDTSTFASASGQHTHQYFGCVWKFGSTSSRLVNASLNVLSEVPVTGTDGQIVTKRSAGVWYTFDSGSNWTQIYNSPQRPKQYDIIPVPDGQDLSKIQVMAFADSHDDMYHKVYDINIVGTTEGTGPLDLKIGRNYYLIFENSVTGGLSDLSPISASTGPIFGGQVPLSDLAISSDPQVDKKIILATADGGDATTLYFLQELDNTTTTTIDNTAEDALLTANIYQETDQFGNDIGVVGNEPPPNGAFPIKHRGRLFMAVGQFLRFSKSQDEIITSSGIIAGRYEEAWPPENQIDISEGAETISGLYSDGVTLYIGTQRHIRRLNGDSAQNFDQPEVVFSETGLANQDVWQTVFYEGTPVGTMWMTPDFKVIGSDFNTYQDIGRPIQSTLNTINPSAASNCWAQFFTNGPYNSYLLAIPTGSNTNPDTFCYYDTKIRKWYIWQFADSMLSGLFYINESGIPRWFFVGDTGAIWLVDPAVVPDRFNTNDSVPITSVLQTTWQFLGDAVTRKMLNEVETMTTETASMLVSVDGASTQSDFLNPHSVIASQPLTQNFLGQWKNFIAGNGTIDRAYRFTFQTVSDDTSLTSDVLLNYFSVEIIPLHRI